MNQLKALVDQGGDKRKRERCLTEHGRWRGSLCSWEWTWPCSLQSLQSMTLSAFIPIGREEYVTFIQLVALCLKYIVGNHDNDSSWLQIIVL